MNNHQLINKVYHLWNKQTRSREDTIKTSVQCSVIRSAFAVKENEIINNPAQYERNQSLSNEEIKNKYLEYVKLSQSFYEYKNKLIYFIEAVSFFNESLAIELKSINHKEASSYA